ncbi:MAG: sulfurtransferase [Actinomycetaceae bacterium]|nr:sulfurtransferase [Actinomycetaceae bacterium]
MTLLPTPLVTAAELLAVTDHPNLVILDATVGAQPTDSHIPGAQVADIDGSWSDHSSAFVHTRPQPEQFEAELRRLGINSDSHVVVYERAGLFSVARPWWLLKWAGFDAVSVLDGGLKAWQEAGGLVTTTPTAARPTGNVEVRLRPELLLDEPQVLTHVEDGDRTFLDARSRGRFAGTEPEPRPGLRGGHIPGSACLPYTEVQDEAGLLPVEKLRSLLGELTDHRPIVTTCGSGVTACVLALALEVCGRKDVSVYDGSWSQWGRLDGPPVE